MKAMSWPYFCQLKVSGSHSQRTEVSYIGVRLLVFTIFFRCLRGGTNIHPFYQFHADGLRRYFSSGVPI